MTRGWVARLADGSVIREGLGKWDGKAVVELWLDIEGRVYSLPAGKKDWIQFKTGSAPVGGGPVTVESRTIGYVESGLMVLLTVDEKTGDCMARTEPGKEAREVR